MLLKIIKYENYTPKIDKSAKISNTAVIIGNTDIKEKTEIGEKVILRGDGEKISIGKNCNFKKRSTVHVASDFLGSQIGDNCIIEQYSVIHACELESNVLIGENAIIMDGSKIGKNSIVMADSLIPPGKKFDEFSLISGSPAKVIKKIDSKFYRNFCDDYFNNNYKNLLATKSFKDHIKNVSIKYKKVPLVKDTVFVAPDSIVNCNLILKKKSSIWFASMLVSSKPKGTVKLGIGSNIQDNSIIDTKGKLVEIGNRVTIGHNVIIKGATKIEDDAVIGMGSIIEEDSHISKNAFVGANSLVLKNTYLPKGQIFAGNPAKFFRKVTDEEKKYFSLGQKIYEKLTKKYCAIYKKN